MSGGLQSVHNCSAGNDCTMVGMTDLPWCGSTKLNTRDQMEALIVEHDIEERTMHV